jgi:hypothetical protein
VSVFDRVAKVQAARLRMRTARHALTTPAAALLVRSRAHPLTTVGAAAGAGFVLGSLGMHPLRVPGLGPLLGGGLAEMVAHGVRLIAELGATVPAAAAADAEGGEPA